LPRNPRREHRFIRAATVAFPAGYGPVWDFGKRFGRGGGSEEFTDVVGVTSPGCPHQYLMRGRLPGVRRYYQERDAWLVRPDHVHGVGVLGVESAESDRLAVDGDAARRGVPVGEVEAHSLDLTQPNGQHR
jgi:hypothetical protein